jgi:7-keto-8-aminopelargonate synthetase-like enzyme
VSGETSRGRLARGVKAALLDTMRKSPVGEKPVHAVSAAQGGRHDMSFASLPAYRHLSSQRSLADAVGVSFPFYRSHDVRAGASSVIGGTAVVNFASYDYLGLNGHPEITKAVAEATAEWGTSVSASRITAGERGFHHELEQALASVS